jgi:hypothetical protein
MFYSTVVKVVREGGEPLAGVQVSLFDKDKLSKDDLVGTGTTGAGGEVSIRFTSDKFDDLDDQMGGPFPELYAVVHGPDGAPVASTRDDAIDNRPRRHITVTVPEAAARQLISAPPAAG